MIYQLWTKLREDEEGDIPQPPNDWTLEAEFDEDDEEAVVNAYLRVKWIERQKAGKSRLTRGADFDLEIS